MLVQPWDKSYTILAQKYANDPERITHEMERELFTWHEEFSISSRLRSRETKRTDAEVLSCIFPYPDSTKIHPMEKHLGIKFKDIILNNYGESLSQDMIDHPESTEMYFEWLGHTHLYVTGQIDEPAPVEVVPIKRR